MRAVLDEQGARYVAPLLCGGADVRARAGGQASRLYYYPIAIWNAWNQVCHSSTLLRAFPLPVPLGPSLDPHAVPLLLEFDQTGQTRVSRHADTTHVRALQVCNGSRTCPGGVWDKDPVENALIVLLVALLPVHVFWSGPRSPLPVLGRRARVVGARRAVPLGEGALRADLGSGLRDASHGPLVAPAPRRFVLILKVLKKALQSKGVESDVRSDSEDEEDEPPAKKRQ